MYAIATKRHGRRFVISPLLLALVLGLGLAVNFTAQVAHAPTASATNTAMYKAYGKWLPAGYGRTHSGHVGTFKSGSPNTFVGFCIDPNNPLPTVTGLYTDTATFAGMSAEQTYQIKYAMNKWATTTSNSVALRAQLAIWRVKNTYATDRYMSQLVTWGYITSADVAAVKAYHAEMIKRGPYKASVTVTPVYVGGSSSGKVIVKAANGTAAPAGISVKVTATSNLRVTSVNGVAGATSGNTRSDGTVTFAYTRTNLNTVTIYATGSYASSVRVVMIKRLSSVQQRMGGNKLYDTFKASASFEKKPGAPTYNTVCSTDCDGTAATTLESCNPAYSLPMKTEYFKNGEAWTTQNAAAGTCATSTLATKDADVITSRSCYTSTLGGACATGYVVNPGSHIVVCPAWAKARIFVESSCSLCSAGIEYTAPVSTRFYKANYYVGNSAGDLLAGSKTLTNGTTETINLTEKVAVGSTITAKFSVYKDKLNDGTLVNPIIENQMLVKIQVLALGSSTATLSVTEFNADGSAAKTFTKTVAADKGKFTLAS